MKKIICVLMLISCGSAVALDAADCKAIADLQLVIYKAKNNGAPKSAMYDIANDVVPSQEGRQSMRTAIDSIYTIPGGFSDDQIRSEVKKTCPF